MGCCCSRPQPLEHPLDSNKNAPISKPGDIIPKLVPLSQFNTKPSKDPEPKTPEDPKPKTPEDSGSKAPEEPESKPLEEPQVTAPGLGEFKCENGHDYIWYTDMPFHYQEIANDPKIRCNRCSLIYSAAGWHCRICLDDICENCALNYNKTPQTLKCKNQHTLFWSPEVPGIYYEVVQMLSFDCDICRLSKNEPSWNCSECNYDLCIECGKKQGILPPFNHLLCDEKHDLTIETEVPKNYVEDNANVLCNKCNKNLDQQTFYHCDACCYDLCLACASNLITNTAPHPAYLCTEGKKLTLKLLKPLRLETGEDFECSSCGVYNKERGYACADCFLCYCLQCSREIGQGLSSFHRKKCPDGHQILWQNAVAYENQKFQCDVCKKIYKSGCFSCVGCNYDVCIKDFKTIS
jgi:hypothetical protein